MGDKKDRTSDYVNILRQADIFYDLTEAQLERIAAICSEVTPDEGEMIFEENSSGDELYVVANGVVDILVSPAIIQSALAGQLPGPMTIATIRRGQTFGEVALVDQGLRSASARCAAKKTLLLVIPRAELLKLCDADPHLGYRLMRNIAADLAFKIRGTDLAIREQLLWGPRRR
ncbi:MAG: cyclic nucleotide-binding domain-containing protein [Anaerolineae bacterium]|nr:cyclic nucleotide-binding domain-containing protein [Anaerolineae bacterium]